MSFLDVLIEEVERSEKLGGPTRETVVVFMTEHRALLERLGAQATKEFFEALYLQGAGNAWEVLAAKLGPEDVLSLLGQTRGEMKQAVAQRAQAMAQFHAFAEDLGVMALRVLTRLVL